MTTDVESVVTVYAPTSEVAVYRDTEPVLLTLGVQGPRGLPGVDGEPGATGATGATGAAGDPASNLVTSVAGRQGVVVLTKTDVGLSNVDNVSNANAPVSTAQAAADALALPKTGGTMTGVLASSVNNTGAALTVANAHATGNGVDVTLPSVGRSGFASKVSGDVNPRIDIRANGDIRFGDGTSLPDVEFGWFSPSNVRLNGGVYVDGTVTCWGNLVVTAGLAVSGGAVTGITKADVGLSNVDNVADSAKPISTLAQGALDAKASTTSPTFTGTVTTDIATIGGAATVNNTLLVTSASVSSYLVTVNNTHASAASGIKIQLPSVNRPALSIIIPGEANNRFVLSTSGMMSWGDGTNLADTAIYRGAADQLRTPDSLVVDGSLTVSGSVTAAVSGATQTALNLKANLASPVLSGNPTAPTAAAATSTTQLATTAFVTTADTLLALKAGDTFTGLVTINPSISGAVLKINNQHASGQALQMTMLDANRSTLTQLVTGDSFNRLAITTGGVLTWGYGTNAVDTNLYRSAADTLKTDDSLIVGGNLTVSGTVTAPVSGATQTALDLKANLSQLTGTVTPADMGLISWSFDPANIGGGSALTAGTIYLISVWVRSPITCTKVAFQVATAGSGLTAAQCWAGLFNSAGTKLSDVDATTAFASGTAYQALTLGASQALTAGRYYVGLLCNGSGMPSLARGSTTNGSATGNLDTTGATVRFATNGSTQTTLTNRTVSSNLQTTSFWVALL